MSPLPTPHRDDPLLGLTLGGCRIDAVLGRGGMGTVYRGHHLALDKPVAVKFLAPHLAGDPSFVERFLHEARAAARIEHPNVVQILNVGQEHDQHFIVMQYIGGVNLQDVLDREGKLDVVRATRITREVAAGLQALHKEGIVHRDIKPANILLPRDGGGVKITDFGLARNLRQAPGPGMTQPGTFMGTPEFVAPEQVLGSVVDGRADLYSLGVTYYLSLAGVLPYPLRNVPEPQSVLKEEEPPPLDALVPDISPRVVWVVDRLLKKAPKDRFPDAAALGEALQSILDGGAKTAAPESPVPEIPVKGRRIPPSAEAAAAPPAAHFGIGDPAAARREMPEAPPPDETPVISAGPKKRVVDPGAVVPREVVRTPEASAPAAPPSKEEEEALRAAKAAIEEAAARRSAPPPAPPVAAGSDRPPSTALREKAPPAAPKPPAAKKFAASRMKDALFWGAVLSGFGMLFAAGALGSPYRSGDLLGDLFRLLHDPAEGRWVRTGLTAGGLLALVLTLVFHRTRLEQSRFPGPAIMLLLFAGVASYGAGVLSPAAGEGSILTRAVRGSLKAWAHPSAGAPLALVALAAGLGWGAGASSRRLLGTVAVLVSLGAAGAAAVGDSWTQTVEAVRADPSRSYPGLAAFGATGAGLILAFGRRRKQPAKGMGIFLVVAGVIAAFCFLGGGNFATEGLPGRLQAIARGAADHGGALSLGAALAFWGGWLLYT
jgi:serine/threonine-protein kinase